MHNWRAIILTAFARRASRACVRATLGTAERAVDGLLWLRARRLFQRSGLFAALPLTGRVLEVEGGRGHMAEAAVHHIPNRRCVVVDSGGEQRHRVDHWVDHRVRRRKFHRVCARPDRLPFADKSFDAAWTTFALGRLEARVQDAVLAEMKRVVRPGGVLVAVEHLPDTGIRALRARLGDGWVSGQPFRARAYRSAEEWRVVLARGGWHIESECTFSDAADAGCSFVCRRT